jgi:hypothetical protein
MATFLVHHRHAADDCAASFAAWKGFRSPLRRGSAHSTCLTGGHALWWIVEAVDGDAALGQLPAFVARRSAATEVRRVRIP